MKILKVTATNFRSYDHLEFDFTKNPGFSLILGKNGFGKSTIFYGILYALYGKLPDNSKGDDPIKLGKKSMSVTLSIQINKHVYTISRYRKDKKYKNKVLLFEGEKDLTLSTNQETDHKIIELLGFGEDTFLNSIFFSPEKVNSFIKATDKERKTILEELTNTNIYKQAANLVKEDLKSEKDKLAGLQKDVDQTSTLIQNQDSMRATYLAYKRNWQSSYDNAQQAIKDAHIWLEQHNFDTLNQKHMNLTTQLRKVKEKSTVHEFDSSNTELKQETDTSHDKVMQLAFKAKQLKANLQESVTNYQQIKNKQLNKCVMCGHVLNAEHRHNELINLAKQIKINVAQYKKLMIDLKNEQSNYQSLTKLLQEEQAKHDQQLEKAREQLKKLTSLQAEYDKAEQLLNQYKQYQNTVDQQERNLLKLKQNKVKKAKELDVDYSVKLKKQQAKVGHAKDKIENLKKLQKVYSDQGVKAQALSLVVPFLNKELQQALKILSNNTLAAQLSSQTTTKSGKKKNQLSLNVNSAISGNQYHELSSGEKKRIGIALNVAFMKYLQSQIGGLNVVIFDELMDNLDDEGIEQATQLISSLKQEIANVFVISHNDKLKYNDECDHIYQVTKENNNSTVIEV